MIFLRISTVRKIINPNGADFARNVKIPYSTYLKYERGERKPPFELLEYLAKQYFVNLNWLVTGEGEMFTHDENSHEQRFEPIKTDFGKFGAKLEALLAENRMTRFKFSDATKIPLNRLTELLINNKKPDLEELIAISKNFKITIDELIFDKNIQNTNETKTTYNQA